MNLDYFGFPIRSKLILLGFGSFFLLGACSSDSSSDSDNGPQVFGNSYSIVSGTPTVDSTISGAGSLSFGDGLILERRSERNFYLDTELSEVGSFLQIHAFADANLANAQIMRLERVSSGLTIQYTNAEGELAELGELATELDGTSRFQVSFDVHNGEDEGSHVIAWPGDELSGEPTEVENGVFGTGKFVGLAFDRVVIHDFRVNDAEAADEE
jgi:hypothetical protein